MSISLKMCYGCSIEPSHLDSSFEHLQHMFWLINMKIDFIFALLTRGLFHMNYSLPTADIQEGL